MEHVRALGYELLGRNVRVGRLEIDIVARDGEVIAVIEVRTRGSTAWQNAFDSVDFRKQARVRRAAQILWSRRFSKLPGVERVSFDVARVNLDAADGPAVEYVRAAFI